MEQIPRPEEAEGLPVAEIHAVFEYTCDACGMLNVVRPVPTEPPENVDVEEDDELDEGSVWQCIPAVVECRSCKAKYATRTPFERFEDEPDDW